MTELEIPATTASTNTTPVRSVNKQHTKTLIFLFYSDRSSLDNPGEQRSLDLSHPFFDTRHLTRTFL